MYEDCTSRRRTLVNQRTTDKTYEKLLVVRAQDRDDRAFHELVTRYERRLLYYIRRLLGSDVDAADVMQEIWMLVFRRLATLRAPEAFRVWLYRIAHDVSVSHLRKHSKWETAGSADSQQALDAAESDDGNESELMENAELVHRALEELSLPHREVLTLRFLEGLQISEIAEVVECSAGTVKSRLHYARVSMRQLLEDYHNE